jgi:hypothetical protein
LKSLKEVHLRPYPPYAQLLHTASIPAPVIEVLQNIEKEFFGSVLNAGPFCSQLVSQLFMSSGIEIGSGAPRNISPFDLGESEQFSKVPDCVNTISEAEAVSFSEAPKIEKLIDFEPTPILSPLLDGAGKIVDRIVHFEQTGSDEPAEVKYRLSDIAKGELDELDYWSKWVSDVFWNWQRDAPGCFANCADETAMRRARTESSILKKLMTPCANVSSCRSEAFSLSRVEQNLEGFRERYR